MNIVVSNEDKRKIKKIAAFIILEFFLLAQTPLFMYANNNTNKKDTNKKYFTQKNIIQNKTLLKEKKKIYKHKKININANKNKNKLFETTEYKEFLFPDKSKIIKYNDVILEFPENSVKNPVCIIIEELKQINNLEPGMYNVTSKALGYRFKPDMNFEKKIKITLPFDKNKITSEYELKNLHTYFYNEEAKEWEKLERVKIDIENCLITSFTDHFTDFINSTLKLPNNPKPLSYNINSIKDIKAANPFTNIPEIEGLEANPYGSANFSIPFTIPKGRKGMQPRLSLSYNSQGGNGWLGIGFSIDVPVIEVDTNFGVPKYDENDDYRYNGKKLYPVEDSGNDRIFRLYTTEKEYERIIRKGTAVDNCYFEITKKDGTKYIYGNTIDSRLESYRNGNSHNPPLSASNNPIYKWFLKRVEDPNGNYITYNYTQISSNPKEMYLSEIRYTGHGSDLGDYRIIFVSNPREDAILDCRGRFKYLIKRRLEEIHVRYGTQIFKKYILNYKYNSFNKSQIIGITERDGNDNDFYSYDFEYNTMPQVNPNNSVDYDIRGFQNTIRWDTGNTTSLSKSSSLTVGGSIKIVLGLGLGFDSLLGAGGGASYQKQFTNTTLCFMDINGDGLPDYVHPPANFGGAFGFFSDNLQYRLNSLAGFSGVNTLTSNVTFAGFLNATQQDDISFFASASAGISVDGSYNNSRSVTHTTISDVNGDGLPDFIMSPGATSYYRANYDYWTGNSTDAYILTSLETTDTSYLNTGIQNSGSMKHTLHLLDPVLKWKSYHKGRIKISGIIKKTGEGGDGIKVNFYKDNFNSSQNYTGSTSLWSGNPTSDLSNDFVDIIIENYDDNTDDTPLTNTQATTEATRSDFLMDNDKTITINQTTDIERLQSIYLKMNSIKTTIGDIAECNLEIIYEEIELHDFMNEYDNVFIPDPIASNVYNDTSLTRYHRTIIQDCYDTSRNLRAGLPEHKINALKEALGQNGYYLVPRRIKHYTFNNISNSFPSYIRNGLKTYYKINNNGTHYILFNTSNLQEAYNRLPKNNDKVDLPDDEIYYKYNRKSSIDSSANEIVEKEGSNLYIDREHAVNNPTSRIYDEGQGSLIIGRNRRNTGVYIDNESGSQKWIKKTGSSTVELIVDGSGTGIYGSVIDGDIVLRDTTPADHDVFYILYNDKRTVPDPIPTAYRSSYSFLHDYYKPNGDLTGDLTEQDKITLSNWITANNVIIDYDVLVKSIRIYQDQSYTVQFQPTSGNNYEDPIVDFEPNNRETNSNTKKSYVYLSDLDNNGDYETDQYYIHVFNAENDFRLNNLRLRDETEDDYEINEPQEYFSGGVYNWYYGEWNGNFLWDITKMATEVTDGTDDSKSFRYFIPMYPLNEAGNAGNTADINYWNKDIWHGTTTHYAEKGFDADGNVKTTDIHETTYISNNPSVNITNDTLEFCASKKGAGAGSGVTGTIATTGLGGLQESTNEAFCFGLGTPWGVGINFNDGLSKSYRDFIDMNGDKYPDQVIFDNNSNCNVIINEDGKGFTETKTFANSHSNLRLNDNFTVGFSLGKGSSIKKSYNAYLKAKQDGVKPKNASFSPSLTASLGHSITQVNFIDINGDGLPDHVRKVPGNGYDVQINLGDTFEDISWSSNDWTGLVGITYNDPTNDQVNDLIGNLNYLQYNNTISTGINLGFGYGHFNAGVGVNIFGSRTKAQLIDINGDGLPDQVVKLHSDNYFLVRLNMGDRFSPNAIYWYTPTWKLNSGDSFVIDNYILNIVNNIFNAGSVDEAIGGADTPGSIDMSGQNMTFSENDTNDFIRNTLKGGENLLNDINPFGAGDVINYGGGFGISVSFTFKIEIPIIPLILSLYIIPGLNFGYSYNSGQLELKDVDGDGLVDHIFRYDFENFARVKLNNAKQVGLLREITTPTGSKITLEYTRKGNTVKLPDCKYVLSKVTKTDGFENGDSYAVEYEYGEGFYDRYKRSFCGFDYICQTNPDDTMLEKYYTNEYYEKGILLESLFSDDNGQPVIHTLNDYEFIDLPSAFGKTLKFARLNGIQTTYHDLGDDDNITKEITFEYDGYGNITEVTDKGNNDANVTNDDIYINIDYDTSNSADYIVGNPSLLHVSSDPSFAMGFTLRKREGRYDNRGNLTEVIQYRDEITNYSYVFGYNNYGNITSMRDPLGYIINYGYDTAVQTYITSITDNLSYSSSAAYDYRYGTELTSTDINNNIITKTYDSFGRLLTVRTNHDIGSTPAISFNYSNCLPTITNDYITEPARALTKNKIHFNASNSDTLDTILYADGLRRIIQTKKTGEIFNGTNKVTGMNVSGVKIFDNMGRLDIEYQPTFQTGFNLTNYLTGQTSVNPTDYTYDILGRIIEIELPDNNTIINEYSITDDNLFKTKVIDPNLNIKSSYADIRENILKVEQSNSNESITRNTTYEYNLLGEITEIYDHNNNNTSITYDYLGRMTSIDNPDMGLIEYFYDANGNVIKKLDSNLRDLPGENGIQYEYDIASRLVRTTYPGKYINTDIVYNYGSSSAGNNTRGRIASITDESGIHSFRYGVLGETTHVTKTLNRLDNPNPTSPYTIRYLYDYLGRMEEIEYPDGEIVTYGYDEGGNVESVTGNHNGTIFNYVNDIGYDKFGQRVYVVYGNGIRTNYTYDPQRRWLENIVTTNASLAQLQDIEYNFDAVGNIDDITNDTTLRYSKQNFTYDFLYQLTNANGTYTDRRIPSFIKTNTYNQSYTYDTIGNMTSKTSSNLKNPGNINPKHLNYSFNYTYDPAHPHRALNIGNWEHKYDLNGNLIERSSNDNTNTNNKKHYDDDSDLGIPNTHNETETNTNETGVAYGWHDRDHNDELKYSDKDVFTWDEENRLRESFVNYSRTRYIYDYKGNRTVKLGSFGENIYVDKIYQEHPTGTATTTKHIFVGSSRIASKIHLEGTNLSYDERHTFYYHPDHLGSSNFITDHLGDVYEHMLYTAYGESWVEETKDNLKQLEYKYTSKEQDRETGLYYFGARYYDNVSSRWISCDPILKDYLPSLEYKNKKGINSKTSTFHTFNYEYIDSGLSKYKKLSGYGGVFNPINLSFYHYAGNNPIIYVDPDGQVIKTCVTYFAIDKDTGLPYVGFASIPGKKTGEQALKYRYSGNYSRYTSKPVIIFVDTGDDLKDGDAKAKARGLEQRIYEALGEKDNTANKQRPVGPNNKRRKDYLKSADKVIKENPKIQKLINDFKKRNKK